MSDYIVQNQWGRLFMRYLNVNPEVYGPAITLDELIRQTEDTQEIIEYEGESTI